MFNPFEPEQQNIDHEFSKLMMSTYNLLYKWVYQLRIIILLYLTKKFHIWKLYPNKSPGYDLIAQWKNS